MKSITDAVTSFWGEEWRFLPYHCKTFDSPWQHRTFVTPHPEYVQACMEKSAEEAECYTEHILYVPVQTHATYFDLAKYFAVAFLFQDNKQESPMCLLYFPKNPSYCKFLCFRDCFSQLSSHIIHASREY